MPYPSPYERGLHAQMRAAAIVTAIITIIGAALVAIAT